MSAKKGADDKLLSCESLFSMNRTRTTTEFQQDGERNKHQKVVSFGELQVLASRLSCHIKVYVEHTHTLKTGSVLCWLINGPILS